MRWNEIFNISWHFIDQTVGGSAEKRIRILFAASTRGGKKAFKKQTFDVCLEMGQTRSWRFPNYVCDTNMYFFFLHAEWIIDGLNTRKALLVTPHDTLRLYWFFFFFFVFPPPFPSGQLKKRRSEILFDISFCLGAHRSRARSRRELVKTPAAILYIRVCAVVAPRTSFIVFRSPHKTTSGTDSASLGGKKKKCCCACLCARVASKANRRACWC